MSSVFVKIINNELPAYRVFEDATVIAILALDQVTPGHTLVIPKQEVNHWFDVPEKDYLHLQSVAQRIARAQKNAFDCPRVMTATVGFEVPHFHLHLLPAWSMDDLNFRNGKKLPAAEMESVLAKIKARL